MIKIVRRRRMERKKEKGNCDRTLEVTRNKYKTNNYVKVATKGRMRGGWDARNKDRQP